MSTVKDKQNPIVVKVSILFLFLTLLVIVSVTCGAVTLTLVDILDGVELLLASGNSTNSKAYIFANFRLPRTIMAILAGAGIAVSGLVIQGLFRNPLVEPGLIGASSGAALFVVIYFVFGVSYVHMMPEIVQLFILPVVAFLGCLSVCLIIYMLSNTKGAISISYLLLIGIAINACVGALIGLATYFADDLALRSFTFWSFGSLAGATWLKVLITVVLISPCIILLYRKKNLLDAMVLGENNAFFLGGNLEKSKVLIIVLIAIIIGVIVSFTGIIGFIGLIIPHCVREIYREFSHGKYMIASMFLGGAVLLLADIVSRTILPPQELPIGMLTALIGAPFFLYILLNNRSKSRL